MAKYCTVIMVMMAMTAMMMGLMRTRPLRLDGKWPAGRRNETAATEQLRWRMWRAWMDKYQFAIWCRYYRTLYIVLYLKSNLERCGNFNRYA